MIPSVLLVTRPLVPPWDEASKNFAYFLGREVENANLTLLTTHEALTGLPPTVREEPIFSSGHFNFSAKIALFRFLRASRADYSITHYLFTPTKLNSSLIKEFCLPTTGKTIQTVATLRDDIYSEEDLKQMLFADELVVYTDRSKEKLARLGFDNVTRIYPGIDLTRYQATDKSAPLLESLSLDTSHFIVMYPGEYIRLGATDMLVDSLIQFFQNNPDTPLRFVFACRVKNNGDKIKKEECQRKFEEASVAEYIRYSDTVSDMPALYNTADVIAFPVGNLSGKFDVPLIIIEAYACQKPVILSDLVQFQEFSDPTFCVSIETGSGTAFIESMALLQENSTLRATLGQNARSFVEANFDLKNTAKQYSVIYQKLVS